MWGSEHLGIGGITKEHLGMGGLLGFMLIPCNKSNYFV